MKKYLLFLFVVCFFLSSCERDDICAAGTPTTPLLVIDFFDVDNPTEQKVPNDLDIIPINAETGELEISGLSFSTATISIPLKTNNDQTQFAFVLNSDNDDNDNPINFDILTFNYLRQQDYVSKACGFRVTYQTLTNDIAPGQDNFWIENVTILNSTVEDETAAHIRILH